MPKRGRTPQRVEHKAGTVTYKVRFRQGGTDSSQTFHRKTDADMFAALLNAGGTAEALSWLDAHDQAAEVDNFATYLEHYISQLTGVTQRTRADYRSLYRRYLTDLGPLPMTLITKAHVAAIVNDMDAIGRSPKTIKNTIHMLSSVMSLAIDEGVITRNPCRRVRLPKRKIGGGERAHFLTHEEVGALIEATPEHYRPLVIFLFGTGMRWSEATAVQTRHVDLVAGTVRVEQAWKREPGGPELGAPKTERSWRTVNAASAALAAIAPLLRRPRDFVFVTPTGRPVLHSNFYNRVWKPACERAGLTDPMPRVHDSRHTHAAWLIAEGKSLEQVQDQLGHESILTTRGTYGALMPALGVETGRAASAALARALSTEPPRALEG